MLFEEGASLLLLFEKLYIFLCDDLCSLHYYALLISTRSMSISTLSSSTLQFRRTGKSR